MAVKIELVRDRIHATIPWMDGKGPRLAKSIPGATPRRNRQKKFIAWTYPLSLEVCRAFRERFGKNLQIGEALKHWARAEIEKEKRQATLREASDADLPRVAEIAPALYKAMSTRTYQKAAARFALEGRKVLIADEPGIGKTLETLAALVEDDARIVLVFAKKKAIETVWAAEVPRWLGKAAKVYPVLGTTPQRRRIMQQFNAACRDGSGAMLVLVCNIEMARLIKVDVGCKECIILPEHKDLSKLERARAAAEAIKECDNKGKHRKLDEKKFPELFDPLWDAIVVDESHKALIGKNARSKAVTQTRLGMMKLGLRDGGMKIALSGTPYRGKRLNAWGTLNWLDPKMFSSMWAWAEAYFEMSKNEFGGAVIGEVRPERAGEFDRMMGTYMIRRTKEEVAPELPPKLYGGTPLDLEDPHSTLGVWIELEPAQRKRYRQIQDGGQINLSGGGRILLNGILAELTRRKQFAICDWAMGEGGKLWPANPANSNKYQWLVEFAEERADAGQKIVVASQYTKVVNAFSAWLRRDGIESYILTGETSERAATASVARFNDPSDPVPVFFINTYAGGESINLDGVADNLVFIDETYIPEDQLQAEDRIHRMSRMHQVNIWYLRSRHTVEEQICRITGARDLLARGSLDGSRGIEIYRRLLEE